MLGCIIASEGSFLRQQLVNLQSTYLGRWDGSPTPPPWIDASACCAGDAVLRPNSPPSMLRVVAAVTGRRLCVPDAGLMFLWSMWRRVTVLESLKSAGVHDSIHSAQCWKSRVSQLVFGQVNTCYWVGVGVLGDLSCECPDQVLHTDL